MIAASGYGSLAPPATAQDDLLDLFFFGNSYTQFNGLTGSIRGLAVAERYAAPNIAGNLIGGRLLEEQTDDLTSGNTSFGQAGRTWDYVVIQGQSLENSFIEFRKNANRLFQEAIYQGSGHAADTTAVLFETWARPPGRPRLPVRSATSSTPTAPKPRSNSTARSGWARRSMFTTAAFSTRSPTSGSRAATTRTPS